MVIKNIIKAHNYFFWIPVIGPYVGGALAGLIYKHATAVSSFT